MIEMDCFRFSGGSLFFEEMKNEFGRNKKSGKGSV